MMLVNWDEMFCYYDILGFTQLQSSFDLVQARFPLSLVTEPPTNGREHFGLPSLDQQGIVILLMPNTTFSREICKDTTLFKI